MLLVECGGQWARFGPVVVASTSACIDIGMAAIGVEFERHHVAVVAIAIVMAANYDPDKANEREG